MNPVYILSSYQQLVNTPANESSTVFRCFSGMLELGGEKFGSASNATIPPRCVANYPSSNSAFRESQVNYLVDALRQWGDLPTVAGRTFGCAYYNYLAWFLPLSGFLLDFLNAGALRSRKYLVALIIKIGERIYRSK